MNRRSHRAFWPHLLTVLSTLAGPASLGAQATPTTPEGAFRALDAWQLEDALAFAAPALRKDPNDAHLRLLAAEVLHQRGQHETASRLLGDVANAGPLTSAASVRRASVAPLLSASAGFAAGANRRETAHFRLLFHDKDEIVASYAEEVLEAAYTAIGEALQFRPAERGEKIAVEFLPNAAALAGATGLHVREIETSGTIAVCRFHRLMVLTPLAVSHGYAWADTLAHEFVHLVVSKKSHNRVPVWLHEGLAKTLESRWRGERAPKLEPHAEQLLRQAVRKDSLVALGRMHPSMAKLKSQQEASLAFAEVFSLVGFVQQKQGPKAFVHLLDALARGENFDAALARNVMPLPQLERAWREALRTRYAASAPNDSAPPRPLRLAPNNGAPAPAGDEDRGNGAGSERIGDANVRAVARLGELLAARGHAQAAARNFAAAHALGASHYPELSFALARAQADANRPQEARATLAAAAARGQLSDGADEGQAEAQWLFAGLLAQQNACTEALRYLRAYNLHNPYRPEAHAVAARCYAALNDPTAAAREQRFAALAAAPRQPRPSPAPPPDNAATLDVLPLRWDAVNYDGGEPQPAPLWNIAVPPGHHCASMLPTGGPKTCVDLPAGAHGTLRP